MNYSEINAKYALAGQLEFVKGKGDLPLARITNPFAKAEISLYGAQVLSFIPKGQKDILWMSPQCIYEPGKPMRGGIPVCFPWFGPHAGDSWKPMHGFARLLTWDVTETLALKNGATRLILGLKSNVETTAIWPFAFSAKMIFEIGEKLDVTFCCTNTGNEDFSISDALHSYFSISDIAQIGILGLKDSEYYAGFSMDATIRQKEDILKIAKEENRRYINHIGDCNLTDPTWNRSIQIAKKGSKVTVVWNPGAETVKTMSDIPLSGYRDFVCIEAVNAFADTIKLKPGESHCISAVLGTEKIEAKYNA
jgi:glucose-6-phosphate 1-epimerase